MKFSVFTVSTPEYTPEEALVKLSELGYDGVEWRVIERSAAKPEQKCSFFVDEIEQKAQEIKKICEKHGLEISALATYLKCSQTKEIEMVLRAAASMNCQRIRVAVPKYYGKENYNSMFERTLNEIKVLEKLAQTYDVKIDFETHLKNIIPSASAAYRLISNFDDRYVGIIHDLGNMVYEGFEQYKIGFELLGKYVDHVHVKNAAWVSKGVSEDGSTLWEVKAVPLWKGQADFRTFFMALKDTQYNGYVSFEDFSDEATTYEKLRDNIAYVKNILKTIG